MVKLVDAFEKASCGTRRNKRHAHRAYRMLVVRRFVKELVGWVRKMNVDKNSPNRSRGGGVERGIPEPMGSTPANLSATR